jgi:hypothetical protein
MHRNGAGSIGLASACLFLREGAKVTLVTSTKRLSRLQCARSMAATFRRSRPTLAMRAKERTTQSLHWPHAGRHRGCEG